MNEQKIIDEVYCWYLGNAPLERLIFTDRTQESLVEYHHSLGRRIRNEFEFWKIKWEPEMVNGVDVSPAHPDAISMRIIEAVWEMARHDAEHNPSLFDKICSWIDSLFIKD